jgi:hypothetical protein
LAVGGEKLVASLLPYYERKGKGAKNGRGNFNMFSFE